MLAATVESAPRAGDGREAYYCNDQGCWVAQQYFCDETGCWITEAPAQALERTFNGDSAPQALGSGAPAPQKAIVQEGISPYPPTPTPYPSPSPTPNPNPNPNPNPDPTPTPNPNPPTRPPSWASSASPSSQRAESSAGARRPLEARGRHVGSGRAGPRGDGLLRSSKEPSDFG